MTWQTWMKQIDRAFEDGDWQGMANLIEEYDCEFSDNENAIGALDKYLADPIIRNALPGRLF